MEVASAERFKGSQRRRIKDKLAELSITAGGIMVLVALILIFFYLLYVVAPSFKSASIMPRAEMEPISEAATIKLGLDEANAWAYRFNRGGEAEFYPLDSGEPMRLPLGVPDGVQIASSALSQPATATAALGLDNGQVLVAKAQFDISYPNDIRTIHPGVRYPLGDALVTLDADGEAISALAFERNDDATTFVWAGADDAQMTLTRLAAEVDFLTDEITWVRDDVTLPRLPASVDELLISPDQRQLFVLANNEVGVWNIRNLDSVAKTQQLVAAEPGAQITDIALLAGASSLLVANDNGVVSQWFMVNSPEGRQFARIRDFHHGAPITALTTEYFRKSFAVGDIEGGVALYYTTSERELLDVRFDGERLHDAAFSPRSNGLVLQSGDTIRVFQVDNPHPEVSFSALWQKVWYEGYPEPAHVWQSTSGSDDFEAKLGLMPLAFGTLKAALYAMLFAVPLAIAGAIYTAYFMSPKVRGFVKPTVEIMEALPTVILGFLAGLWLAPLVEANLPGIILLLLALPLTMLVAAFAWHKSPEWIRNSQWGEYRELLLLPLLLLVGWLVMAASPYLELYLMGGDARGFVTNTLGITFDQRNALVVGLAMGFAVIPTIFSIAEDAVFSVPRHLINGSLALGATQWQTLTRVVLLTASPGIFSAVMMGFGRAVGETMIVLMATGNTPLMEWNIFQGMRTLAANIAVEMPESAIDSTHYRVLFLTAFVLFVFTFIFNTLAEYIRQRLREKYSTL
ncbi:ABC transporter permease subunit [Ferrimonas balearica]|uniref:ABC transporter permease subunit n=1 Tax=Ferrimonas balearica TaxID=44012 RepID=UPI001C99BB3B|nr:ABC transporter permease subunit [Ferrimonas balearica]MBY5921952.1 ABC transporter permease subunit [Ferrimonas balearica]MBY5994708.1 ABC transporter permease subunit [Ferrimonas balearica]